MQRDGIRPEYLIAVAGMFVLLSVSWSADNKISKALAVMEAYDCQKQPAKGEGLHGVGFTDGDQASSELVERGLVVCQYVERNGSRQFDCAVPRQYPDADAPAKGSKDAPELGGTPLCHRQGEQCDVKAEKAKQEAGYPHFPMSVWVGLQSYLSGGARHD